MAAHPRRGSQEPTFRCVGEYDSSLGPRVADVFEGWGTRFYPCQRDELELLLARRADGRFAAKTISISKPRQNGKSFGTRKYAIWMAAGEGANVLYTAHHGDTTKKMFKLVKNEVERTPELAALLRPGEGIYKQRGAEGIYFVGADGRSEGGCIEFQTRTTGGARGETYQIIVVDEAQELTYDEWDAVKPTTLASGEVDSDDAGPQMIYLGTPPGPKCPGDVFRDMHERAHSDDPGDAWWVEWAADVVPDLGDVEETLELAYRTNPAMGYRIREDVMLDAIEGYRARPDSYAREYLGWWSPLASFKSAIDPARWRECAIDMADAPPTGKVAYGIRFDPSGTRCAIAVATVAEDRLPHVELVSDENITATGTGWVADFIVERQMTSSMFAIDGRGNADAVAAELKARGVQPRSFVRCGTREVIAASSMLVNAVRELAITHLDDPVLQESAATSGRRPIGSAGGFGFGGEYAGPVEAASLALWAVRTSTYDPTREGRIG